MDEVWRSIAGYEGVYEVSDLGRVRSLTRVLKDGRRKRGQLLRPSAHPRGYRTVRLCLAGQRHTVSVHRLVMETFVGPRPAGLQVCHGNNDRADNRLSNLRYDTPSANQQDRVAHGTSNRGERCAAAKLRTEDVRAIRQLLRVGVTQQMAANLYGVSQPTISDIASRRTWAWLEAA